jgi:hypothetical protein
MANVSVAVEIETRTEHVLSIAFQGVADDQSANVGTLLISPICPIMFIIPEPPIMEPPSLRGLVVSSCA